MFNLKNRNMLELMIKIGGLLVVIPVWFVGMFEFIQTI